MLRELRWILHDARIDGPTLAACAVAALPAMRLEPDEQDEIDQWERALAASGHATLPWAGTAGTAVGPGAAPDNRAGAGRRWRLGLHVEQVLHAWLRASGRIHLIAANWPLRAAGRTIGEADLLVRRASGAFEHWEVAFKIYLDVGADRHVGLDGTDTLAGKCRHMRNQQLRLTQHPAFAPAWRAHVAGQALPQAQAIPPDEHWDARAILSGWLFGPLDRLDSRASTRPHAWFVRNAAAFERITELGATLGIDRWVDLPREAWLMPLVQRMPGCGPIPASCRTGGFEGLPSAFGSEGRPRIVAGVGTDERGILTERLRLIAVDQRWADEACAPSSPISASES